MVTPKVGLALGGGGVRGVAHVGILKVLQANAIPVNMIAGTSIGGIVAAPFAAGIPADTIAEEVLRLGRMSTLVRLIDWAPSRRGLIQGQNIYKYLAEHLGGDLTFEELQIPLALTAVDMNNGAEVVLDSGPVIDAIRATMAVPGIIAPVEADGRKLVDGGILNNVPADLARKMGADVLIAVDVSAARLITDPSTGLNAEQVVHSVLAPNFALEIWRAQMIMMQEIVRLKLEIAQPEILLTPPVPPEIGMFNGANRLAELIEIGEQAATDALPQIMAAIKRATENQIAPTP